MTAREELELESPMTMSEALGWAVAEAIVQSMNPAAALDVRRRAWHKAHMAQAISQSTRPMHMVHGVELFEAWLHDCGMRS